MLKKYKITPLLWLVKDEASVKFHIKSDDYFGTMATILGLLKQQIKNSDVKNVAILKKTLDNLEKDLMFLQKNYRINYRRRPAKALYSNPKIKNKNKTPKGKLNSQ